MITKITADRIVNKYKNYYKKEIIINKRKLYLYNYILKDYKIMQDEPLARELRGLIITDEPQQVFLSVPSFFNNRISGINIIPSFYIMPRTSIFSFIKNHFL